MHAPFGLRKVLQYSPRPVRHRDEEHVSQLLLARPPQPPEVEEEREGVPLGSQLQRVVEATGGGVGAAAEKEPGYLFIFQTEGKFMLFLLVKGSRPGAVVGGRREGIQTFSFRW